MRRCLPELLKKINGIFARLEQDGVGEMRNQDISPEPAPAGKTTDAEIRRNQHPRWRSRAGNVPEMARAFHPRLPPRTLRVRLSGPGDHGRSGHARTHCRQCGSGAATPLPESDIPPVPHCQTRVYLNGEFADTPVYLRRELQPGRNHYRPGGDHRGRLNGDCRARLAGENNHAESAGDGTGCRAPGTLRRRDPKPTR